MAETTTEEEKEFKMTHEDGSISLVKGRVITTDHGVLDADGNPKISVHVSLDKTMQPWPAVDPVVAPTEEK